jgi:hypothetical protein
MRTLLGGLSTGSAKRVVYFKAINKRHLRVANIGNNASQDKKIKDDSRQDWYFENKFSLSTRIIRLTFSLNRFIIMLTELGDLNEQKRIRIIPIHIKNKMRART